MFSFSQKFRFLVMGLSVGLVGLSSFCAAEEITQAQAPLPIQTLTIKAQNGHANRFEVEVARTDKEQEIGEMFRKNIPANRGMLFIWSYPREVAMWMKNTYVPLDMLFIDEKNHICSIEENTVPMSEAVIRSHCVTASVLEVPAGTSEKLGLIVGDEVMVSQGTAKK